MVCAGIFLHPKPAHSTTITITNTISITVIITITMSITITSTMTTTIAITITNTIDITITSYYLDTSASTKPPHIVVVLASMIYTLH